MIGDGDAGMAGDKDLYHSIFAGIEYINFLPLHAALRADFKNLTVSMVSCSPLVMTNDGVPN